MHWIISLARVLGASNPISGMGVQLSAEIEGRAIEKRFQKLEDPISSLHPDIREVSRLIYQSISQTDSSKIVLPDSDFDRYAKALAILDAHKLINGSHAIGKKFAGGFWVSDPSYVLYMAALYEDQDLMERFAARVNATPARTWLRGDDLSQEYALPLPVIRAVFQLGEQHGLGLLSKEIGSVNYYVTA